MRLIRCILCLCLVFIPYVKSSAAEINFSGFATIAGGITLDDDESYDGYDDSFDFNPNSLLAIQASSDLGDGWGITTQLLARGSDDWDIKAEWAFISYDATDDWRILVGRQRAPFYLYSDFLDVSYAYHWIKPPVGVYSIPFDVIDGVGSIYNSTLGEFDSTVHLTYGRNQEPFQVGGEDVDTDIYDFFSAAWSINRDWLTLRLSYARTDIKVDVPTLQPILDGWAAAGFPEVGSGIAIDDDTADFAGFAIIIDYEDFLIVSEYTTVDPGGNSFIPNDSYYLSIGKRFDNMLFHITYGADDATADLGFTSHVPAGVDPGLDFLLATTAGIMNDGNEDSTYFSLGLRWEVSDAVAFKVEYTSFDNELGGEASLLQFALTTVF